MTFQKQSSHLQGNETCHGLVKFSIMPSNLNSKKSLASNSKKEYADGGEIQKNDGYNSIDYHQIKEAKMEKVNINQRNELHKEHLDSLVNLGGESGTNVCEHDMYKSQRL